MPKEFVYQTFKLTEEQWQHLLELAAATGSIVRNGLTTGQPSWRTLIKRLANGDFILTPVKPEPEVPVQLPKKKRTPKPPKGIVQ